MDRMHISAETARAIFGFEGDVTPTVIDLILISQDAPNDRAIHQELDRMLGSGARAMALLSDSDLSRLEALAPPGHPLAELADPVVDEELEEAALGSAAAVRALRRRPVRRQSADELALARLRAAEVGRDGEALVAAYLSGMQADGKIAGFTWDSDVNAVNPWDMTIHRSDGTHRRTEVKSTTGPHDRTLHISQAELEAAIETGAPRTEIWRISELTGTGGTLRRSRNFREVSRAIVDAARSLGDGIIADSWSVSPSRLQWSDPRPIAFDEEPDE